MILIIFPGKIDISRYQWLPKWMKPRRLNTVILLYHWLLTLHLWRLNYCNQECRSFGANRCSLTGQTKQGNMEWIWQCWGFIVMKTGKLLCGKWRLKYTRITFSISFYFVISTKRRFMATDLVQYYHIECCLSNVTFLTKSRAFVGH